MTLTTPLNGVPILDIEVRLVAAAVRGDERAFEQLYRRHLPRIHTLVRRMTRQAVAEELTQDVFVRAWHKLGTFRGDSAFGTWLHRLAVNVVITELRRRRTELARLVDDDSQMASRADRPAASGVRIDLEMAMAELPDGARQVFVLHDIEGWTHGEIAEQLGLVPGTSKSQLSRARAILRRRLDGY